ncbi:MAG: MG2 domain-containing protein, partial [Pirellulales bacterium]
MQRHVRLIALSATVLFTASMLWQLAAAENAKKKPADDDGRITTAALGGQQRFLTHLSTDKPIYRAGETLYMRGVLLHHATHKPLPQNQNAAAVCEIKGPKGDTVASGFVNAQQSVLGYSWTVPEGQAGGEYTIKVSYPGHGYSPAERKFDIRAYRAPRLKSQIKFLRDGYGPGDAVVAMLEVNRAEGGVPADAKVTVIARVDGRVAYEGQTVVDDEGRCEARFQLPKQIARGEGTLALVIEDGGVVETASKTIPILLQTVDLAMYPESGDLVAGLHSRVYLEAFTPAKKPADLAGVVVDNEGRQVATFRSEHEGRARFELTPQAGKKYTLKITEPSGIKTEYPLPETRPAGAVVLSNRLVCSEKQCVTLKVGAVGHESVTVTLSKRERELLRREVAIDGPNLKTIGFTARQLDKVEAADGVLTATVWSQDGKPLAERLVFRRPAQQLNVKITADAPRYVPGGKAQLTIETTDAEGRPVSAVVGVTVTDDSVLEMIERRDQAPRLPVMVLLENDVRDLADAHLYLDPENGQAPQAVDLLLGTQGWRRFATVDTAKWLAEHGDNGRRALAMRINTVRDLELQGRGPGGGVFQKFKGDVVFDDGLEIDEAEVPRQDDPEFFEEPEEEQVAANAAAEKPRIRAENKRADKNAGFRAVDDRSELQKALGKALDRDKRRLIAKEQEDINIAVRNDFVAVRIFAHQVRPGRQPGERVDFTETLFWQAGIKTNDEGKAV